MCILFNLAKPELLIARMSEELSPWFRATEYKNVQIYIKRVYSPMYGFGAWCAAVLLNDGEYDDLGSVYKDLQIALSDAREYIDEIKER